MVRIEDEKLFFSVGGEEARTHYSFWRGDHTNFMPTAAAMQEATALGRYVLAGWMPPEPFIDPDTTIVAFGSCFATHISSHLNNLGFRVENKRKGKAYVSKMGDGIVNTYAIRQQFEWAWEAVVPTVELWHGYKAEQFGYGEEERVATKEMFDAADVFILTLGLSEIWYDEPTGQVFWRAVPYESFDPQRHKFRVATVSENLANLNAIMDLIRRHRPDATVVFTLSPVPLSATFRPVSCITANTVSKAILRSALDELFNARSGTDPKLYYFPAFEVVTQCFKNPFESDMRHPLLHVLDVNLTAFERHYCKTGLTDADVEAVFLDALVKDRGVGALSREAIDQLSELRQQWVIANPAATLRLDEKEAERQRVISQSSAERQARLDRRAAREQRRSDRGSP
jgi:hypothetical protein